MRALFVPGDDAVFHAFIAESIDTVREAGARAAIQFEGVVEQVEPVPGPVPAGFGSFTEEVTEP